MARADIRDYPQPALRSDGARITELNEKARAAFPGWQEGAPLPEQLLPPEEAEAWEAAVELEGRGFQVRCTREEEGWLYVFQPQSQQALTEGQLDGALYQLRSLMGEFYRELSPYVSGREETFSEGDKNSFSKSYYRMLRLMEHLDFLRDAADGQIAPDGEVIDLNELCARVALECDGLLREMDVRVEFTPCPGPAFLRGDRARLRDAFLELISNCAKRVAKGGVISLRLSRKGRRAIVCVTDSGREASSSQQLGMTDPGFVPLIPTADMGARLGLSVVREILRLHRGALLVDVARKSPRVYVSLPLREPGGAVSMHSPRPERNPGMSPYMIALSDVLPDTVIREDWME